jgi:formate hydrogenlyase subunit 4
MMLSISLVLAASAPWIAPKYVFSPCDVFFLLYMLTAYRFLVLLLALDTSSPFGTFAAGREAALSFLAEPAAILSLASLAVRAHTSNLNLIFAQSTPDGAVLWFISGSAFLLASLVDLSRMPIDDPTTHLELTMVHEALILEGSGRNLALLEASTWIKLSILLGLSSQCYLHALPQIYLCGPFALAGASFIALFSVAVALGIFESLAVKLHWRKAPEFIAYALTLTFVASIIALGAGRL